MRTLLVASGNSLRGDDGVAHRVVQLLGARAEARSVMQLTPELAAEIAGFDTVIFLDAAVGVQAVSIEEVPKPSAAVTLTHVSRPAEIVALSAVLFGFRGRALECRIPVADFGAGEQLSPLAERFANEAAHLLVERTI